MGVGYFDDAIGYNMKEKDQMNECIVDHIQVNKYYYFHSFVQCQWNIVEEYPLDDVLKWCSFNWVSLALEEPDIW